MRTAYLTLDEVNARRAIQLGSRCGQAVHLVDLRSTALLHEPVLILDLDHLLAEEAASVLQRLLARPGLKLGAHAYHFPAGTVRQLVRAGVVVRRRLDAALFRRLHRRRRSAVQGANLRQSPLSCSRLPIAPLNHPSRRQAPVPPPIR
jgi:hypothetical protein